MGDAATALLERAVDTILAALALLLVVAVLAAIGQAAPVRPPTLHH
ncbi:hypothetical protein OOK13_41335 [Streptomyces sp. NBC_00378]|nr:MULTISPECIES: hypothetical protein [unclassified Streptomyces]MCX5114790.1 hypothetical protein [Streptomyces sp. NBC_00378]